MNSAQKQRLEEIRISVKDLYSELEEMLDDERDKYDNMSEGLQQTSRGEEISNAIDELETIVVNFELIGDSLENIINY